MLHKLRFEYCVRLILSITKENKWEEMGRNECRPTASGYILKTLLGLCFNSIFFSFISDGIASLRKSYIFKISLAILIYCCCTPVRTRFSVEMEKNGDIKSEDKSNLIVE